MLQIARKRADSRHCLITSGWYLHHTTHFYLVWVLSQPQLNHNTSLLGNKHPQGGGGVYGPQKFNNSVRFPTKLTSIEIFLKGKFCEPTPEN